MKSTLMAEILPAPVRPLIVAQPAHDYSKRKIRKILAARQPSPPSEETINRLNGIGREYPFCVYYKQKRNDPL